MAEVVNSRVQEALEKFRNTENEAYAAWMESGAYLEADDSEYESFYDEVYERNLQATIKSLKDAGYTEVQIENILLHI